MERTLYPIEYSWCMFGGYQNKETVWDIREWDHDNEIQKKFPNFKHAKSITIIQNAGETIFVPSGWYHQVENLVCYC